MIAGLAFAIHVGLEHLRFRNAPQQTALHAAAAVGFGAFALAAAANIHALRAGTGNQRLLAVALVLWPIITAVPAFMVALVSAVVLARLRPNEKSFSP